MTDPLPDVEAHLKRNDHTHGFAMGGDCPKCKDEQQHSTCDALLRALSADLQRLREENRTFRRGRNGDVWCWQGDAQDKPESLTCPVLMSAEDVRKFVAAESQVQQLQEENARLRLQLLWQNGNADEFAKLLKEIALWTRIDNSEHGPGPAGGYQQRVEFTERAQQLGLTLLAKVERLTAERAGGQAHQEDTKDNAGLHR